MYKGIGLHLEGSCPPPLWRRELQLEPCSLEIADSLVTTAALVAPSVKARLAEIRARTL